MAEAKQLHVASSSDRDETHAPNGDLDYLSVASSESNDISYFTLSEDHFGEVVSPTDNDENGLPIDKREIVRAINKHMKLIRIQGNDDEQNKKLIVKLCELRIKLNRMEEEAQEQFFFGHRLSQRAQGDATASSLVCDMCMKKQKIILIPPGLLRSFNFNFVLTCDFCDFQIHRCCMTAECKPRRCPRELFDEEEMNDRDEKYSKYINFEICPETGLMKQGFSCAECHSDITQSNSRLCDYDGMYYCYKCHWNDLEPTPARVLHNWDFDARPVSRRSLQILTYLKRKPVLFNLLEFNTMLYGLVDELNLIKRLRVELALMFQYAKLCHQPSKPKMAIHPHLVEEEHCDSFSTGDLLNVDGLQKQLGDLHTQLFQHITKDCEGCRGKGFYCELCRDKADLLFPFSANIANCPRCNTVFHKNCYHRKHKNCPKCNRLREKQYAEELALQQQNVSGGEITCETAPDDIEPKES